MALSEPERVGVAVVRVWIEGDDPDALRIRVGHNSDVARRDQDSEELFLTVEATIHFLESWLRSYVDSVSFEERADEAW